MSSKTGESARDEFIAEVQSRPIGPSAADGELREKPNKRYLTEMVFPKSASTSGEAGDEEDFGDDLSEDDEEMEVETPMDMLFQKLLAPAGITFALANDVRSIRIGVSGARYEHVTEVIVVKEAAGNSAQESKPSRRQPMVWKRMMAIPGTPTGKPERNER